MPKKEYTLREIINVPDMITFFNLISGLTSIYFAFNNHFLISIFFLVIAAILDFLDGKSASILDQKTDFGKQIDSLSDLISFGVAIAFFGFALAGSKDQINWILLVSLNFYILCGAIRLARYNISKLTKTFIGMPITMNVGIFILLFFINFPVKFYWLIYFISGILMISQIRVKKI